MRVVVSTPGKFHSFHLARELERRSALTAIFSTYPRFKLRREGIPSAKLRTYGWLHTPYMAMPRRDLLGTTINRQWEWLTKVTFDNFVSRQLPACDVFVGMSGSSLRSGEHAKKRGGKFVCDRGSAHIQVQDAILRAEHDTWGIPFDGIDPRVIDQELAEYETADCITVPSSFVLESFVLQGTARDRLRLLPYGVELSEFFSAKQARRHGFNILFVGAVTLQKGVQYLLQAYQRLAHPAKSLTLAGSIDPQVLRVFRKLGMIDHTVKLTGHVNRRDLCKLYGKSHVFVLPSVQDGFAMVITEAMSSGLPVIASDHSGGPDVITSGVDGYIVPAKDSNAILDRLQYLADTPEACENMGLRAAEKALSLGGWGTYGDAAAAAFSGLL